jgi:CRISPR/Cas system-associated protein endoribonuclease Cas2
MKKPRTKTASKSNSSSVFGGSSLKSHRRLQETEVYSKLFYNDRIEDVVRERLKTAGPDVSAISVTKSVTKELFEGEDEETRAMVAAKVAEARDLPIENNIDDLERTPKQYQRLVFFSLGLISFSELSS